MQANWQYGLLLCLLAGTALANPATTLTGDTLRQPDFPPEVRARLDKDLLIAHAVHRLAPEREDSWIWLGRRYGYLGLYPEAIDVFTRGLERFPDSYKLYRFRGRHRARNRNFAGAIADYRAGLDKMHGVPDTFEPDGLPNARRLTISTYRSNMHYYLGQTSFATGDFQAMSESLQRSLDSEIALPIDDHKVAVAFWRYIALRKLGQPDAAQALIEALPAEPVLIENEFYFRAMQALTGELPESIVREEGDSLARFGLAMRLVFAGRKDEATELLHAIVNDNALGYWPAEAELLRLQES